MAYGLFGSFGVGGFFTNITTSTLVYIAFFIILLAIINKALKKPFREQGGVRTVLSLVLALIFTWALTKANFNFENLLYGVGISQQFLTNTLPWILLVVMIIIIWFWGLGRLFMIFGLIFISLAISGITEEKGFAWIIGIVLLIVGWRLYKRRKWKKDYNSMNLKEREEFKNERSQKRWRRWGHAKKVGKYTIGKPTKGLYNLGKKAYNRRIGRVEKANKYYKENKWKNDSIREKRKADARQAAALKQESKGQERNRRFNILNKIKRRRGL